MSGKGEQIQVDKERGRFLERRIKRQESHRSEERGRLRTQIWDEDEKQDYGDPGGSGALESRSS